MISLQIKVKEHNPILNEKVANIYYFVRSMTIVLLASSSSRSAAVDVQGVLVPVDDHGLTENGETG